MTDRGGGHGATDDATEPIGRDDRVVADTAEPVLEAAADAGAPVRSATVCQYLVDLHEQGVNRAPEERDAPTRILGRLPGSSRRHCDVAVATARLDADDLPRAADRLAVDWAFDGVDAVDDRHVLEYLCGAAASAGSSDRVRATWETIAAYWLDQLDAVATPAVDDGDAGQVQPAPADQWLQIAAIAGGPRGGERVGDRIEAVGDLLDARPLGDVSTAAAQELLLGPPDQRTTADAIRVASALWDGTRTDDRAAAVWRTYGRARCDTADGPAAKPDRLLGIIDEQVASPCPGIDVVRSVEEHAWVVQQSVDTYEWLGTADPASVTTEALSRRTDIGTDRALRIEHDLATTPEIDGPDPVGWQRAHDVLEHGIDREEHLDPAAYRTALEHADVPDPFVSLLDVDRVSVERWCRVVEHVRDTPDADDLDGAGLRERLDEAIGAELGAHLTKMARRATGLSDGDDRRHRAGGRGR